ncbi:hypothetical protein JCM19992_20610 [Thermostilla marina]
MQRLRAQTRRSLAFLADRMTVDVETDLSPSKGFADTLRQDDSVEQASYEVFVGDASDYSMAPVGREDSYHWQVLPDGLIYRSYLAGVKESRFASQWMHERDWGWMWDIALGGRVGIFRYGTGDSFRPEGFQVDIEGAGLPRLDMEHENDVISADFRFGIPITFGTRQWQTKFAYYHLSSHLGDEFLLRFPGTRRLNYSRDVLVLGESWYPIDELRLYAEMGWAFSSDGGSKPWEFQFGVEYTPAVPGDAIGAPFVAVGSHLREEVDFGGNLVVQTGWMWLAPAGHMFRMGMQYFVGQSEQFEFYDQYEEKLGLALWYDY